MQCGDPPRPKLVIAKARKSKLKCIAIFCFTLELMKSTCSWNSPWSPNHKQNSIYSQYSEAARAMQVTRPNEIRAPGVRLHPKACAALGLEAERATPKRLGTPVQRTCMHALGTGYARKSGEPLGFRPKERTCASTGAHPFGETSMSR